ncbi:hypothetical protein BGZ54_008531 [Gamsiella multidivaricata]|nr:hypothetical protein BGZ54_008531 [Gamsiella multidivaricata]
MDVPMRSFFPEYYPNLVRLYRSIGVKFHDADNTLSCFDVDIDSSSAQLTQGQNQKASKVRVHEPYLSSRSYRVGSDQTITLPDLPLFSVFNPFPFGRRILGYYRIAKDYLRMLIVSKEFMAKGRMMDIGKHPIEWGNGRMITLREFLEAGGYSHDFAAFFVPLFASVCTCSFERMMEYPACVVLEYVARCMPFGRMQFVSEGIQDVTERLSGNIDTVHYNTTIEDIITDEMDSAEGSEGPVVLVDSYGNRRVFDHVIFASQANQAAATLAGHKAKQSLPKPFHISPEAGYDEGDYGCKDEHDQTESEITDDLTIESIKPNHPFSQQIKALLKFPYERIRVVCHTDTSFLPKNPAHWRLLNIAKSSSADVLASPMNKISKELEAEMAYRSRKAKAPRPSIFSLRATSAMSRTRLGLRKTSHSRLRAHFALATTSSCSSSMAAHSHNSAMATHVMNSTTALLGSTTKYLQTSNPIYPPRPDSVISSAWFERAVVNPASMKAIDELDLLMEQQTDRWQSWNAESREQEQQPSQTIAEMPVSDRIWFAGSYAYPGIPLLEGCVASALQAIDRIVTAESRHQLAPSAAAPESSFLKREAPMRERRQYRQERLQEDRTSNSALRMGMSAVYFQSAWKDAQEDEQYESEKDSLPRKGRLLSSWRSRSVYVEVAWMLILYAVAVSKWMLVIVVESFGGDGSRWALA